MKCKYFLRQLLTQILCISCTITRSAMGKYVISGDDSVSLTDCNLDDIRNISTLNADPLEIVIHSCQLSGLPELPNALFIRFHKLRILEITDSHLKSVGDFAFNGLNDLRILNLQRNNITNVNSWSYQNLESLHTLDLRRNAIVEVHKFAFTRYPKLLKLNLAVNHLQSLPDDLFRPIPLLKHLNLGKNNLKKIDSHTFRHLHKLIHLELKNNEIELIEGESFVGLTHMRILHLQDNKLTSFEQELITNMPRLHHLNISHNLLQQMKDETFEKNEELISLDISFNEFEYFSNLSFKGLEVLEVLNASHNAIKHISNAILTDFANLKVLDLSNNQITHLSDKLFDTTQLLKSIKLNDNLLQQIDTNVFTELKLQHLDLSCNNLSSDNFLWPETISIAYLNLTFNAYTDINSLLLDNIETDLYENPFACDWLVEELSLSQNIRYGRDYVVHSRHDLFITKGIKCYERDTNIMHRLIVLEPIREVESEDVLDRIEEILPTSTIIDNAFDYRSVLLWLSLGCLGVFLVLHVIRFVKKSENQNRDRVIVPQQHIQMLSADDEK